MPNTTYKQYRLRDQTKGLRIFIRSQNLWDFALNKEKKTKQKDFAMCVAESKR